MTTTRLAMDRYNHAIQALKPGTCQTVAYTGTAARTTNAMSGDTLVVRLVATTDCFVLIGTGSPTAATTDMFLPGGQVEYFRVDGKDTVKISAIRSVADGSLYVTEMT